MHYILDGRTALYNIYLQSVDVLFFKKVNALSAQVSMVQIFDAALI